MAIYSKANNTTNLDNTGSWVGGTVPTSADIGRWDSTVTGANTTVLGSNLSWAGVDIADPGGLVTINAGSTLTVGASGITLNGTRSLTANCGLTSLASTSQSWTAGSGRNLTIGGAVSHDGGTITYTGAGQIDVTSGSTYNVGTTVATTLSMTGLTNFNGSNISTYNIGSGSAAVTSTATLAPTSTLIATTTNIGASGGNVAARGTVSLGAASTIRTNTLNIGVKRCNGTLNFGGGTGGSLTLTGLTGGASKVNVICGQYNTSPGNYNPTGLIDCTNNSIIAQIDTIKLGDLAPSGNVSSVMTTQGTFTIDGTASNVDASNVFAGIVSVNRAPTANTQGRGIINMQRGTATFFNLRLGDMLIGANSETEQIVRGDLNVNGGDMTVSNQFTMGDNNWTGLTTANVIATLTLNGGTLFSKVPLLTDPTRNDTSTYPTKTIFTLSGGTLDMSGNNIGTAEAAIGSGSGSSINWQSGTLRNVSTINGSQGITKTTNAGLTLQGLNAYTGPTKIDSGIIYTTVLADGGNNSNIGNQSNDASNLILNGGSLHYSGADQNWDRLFTITENGGGFYVEGSIAFNFTNSGSLVCSGTGNRTLSYSGTNSTTYITPIHADGTGGVLSIGTGESGSRVLLANNTFTGQMGIGGNLFIYSIADGGSASPIGASSNAASNLRFNFSGALLDILNFTDMTTDRLFTINSDQFMTFQKLQADGNSLLTFTNPGAIAWGQDPQIAVMPFIMGGGNPNYNRFYPTFSDYSTAGGKIMSLAKQDAGIWMLEGNHTYTGVTLNLGGSLYVDGSLSKDSTVSNFATLAGIGNVAGPVTSYAGSLIVPGNEFTGVLSTGPLTMLTDSTLWAFAWGFNLLHGGIQVNGTANITGSALIVGDVFDPAPGNIYHLLDSSGLTGTFANYPNNSIVSLAGHKYRVKYTSTSALLLDISNQTQMIMSS